MPKPFTLPAVEATAYKRVLSWEGQPVLQLSLRVPRLAGDGPGVRRINRCYEKLAGLWRGRWEGPLYQRACAAAQAARAAGDPVRPWQAQLDFTLTLAEGHLLSLYLDIYEFTGGAHGLTLRQGDTWQLPAGTPLPLSACYPPRCRWRRQVLTALHRQAAQNVAGGETLYYEDWPRRLTARFDPDRFYLTPQGIALFYPLYAIGPYAEGIPVFLLPYPRDQSPG